MKDKRQIKYPGIVECAEALGVSREHLYRVLEGDRESAALTHAWQYWKQTGKVSGEYKGRAELKLKLKSIHE